MTTTAMPESLGAALRTNTRTIHLEVERSPFMQALLKGQLSRATYAVYLRNLEALYAELERVLLANRSHPVLAPLVQVELFRAARLAEDLNAVHGAGWRDELRVLPATIDYVQHLGQLGTLTPQLLLAHVYVRSMGDLSGGQLVQKIVAESLQLGPEALRFYDFGSPDVVLRLVQGFRGAMAGLVLPPGEQAELVAEAVRSFERHRQIFAELMGT